MVRSADTRAYSFSRAQVYSGRDFNFFKKVSATMGETALKAIDNWCRCLTEDETLRYTEALGLKRNGGTFRKLERLSKWLAGDYEPEDFAEIAAADELTAWVERANARRTFLGRTSGTGHDISWANSMSDEPHPLEILKTIEFSIEFSNNKLLDHKTDESVQENLERSRAWAAEVSRHGSEDPEIDEASTVVNDNRGAATSGQDTTNQRPAMFEMSMADGTMLQVPTEWAMYMAAVDKKLRQIEESMRLMTSSMHQPNANSTRRESGEGPRRVTFTDNAPAGRNSETRRDEAQGRNIVTPRQNISGWELHPPGQHQQLLEPRLPPPTTPLTRRPGLGGAWGGSGSQSQPAIPTDSEIR